MGKKGLPADLSSAAILLVLVSFVDRFAWFIPGMAAYYARPNLDKEHPVVKVHAHHTGENAGLIVTVDRNPARRAARNIVRHMLFIDSRNLAVVSPLEALQISTIKLPLVSKRRSWFSRLIGEVPTIMFLFKLQWYLVGEINRAALLKEESFKVVYLLPLHNNAGASGSGYAIRIRRRLFSGRAYVTITAEPAGRPPDPEDRSS
jgi:hypothetical protein